MPFNVSFLYSILLQAAFLGSCSDCAIIAIGILCCGNQISVDLLFFLAAVRFESTGVVAFSLAILGLVLGRLTRASAN